MSGSPCACDPGYAPNPSGAGCIVDQYKLVEPEDQVQLSDVEPGASRGATARVVSALTGLPKQGAVVKIHLDVDPASGGHDHGEHGWRRSRGSISGCVPELSGALVTPDSYDCTTGPDGYAGFTFSAPDISGKHTITATCLSPFCSGSKTAGINVKVDGLATIPASQFYTFVGGEAGKPHRDNHYLTPQAESVLHLIALYYHRIGDAAPPSLYLNDASLVWGGRFDTRGNWGNPHAGHRRGVVIDVRANHININNGAIPLASFAKFKEMAMERFSADAQVHCTSTMSDGQNRQPPACIGKDGSQDSNRHFHILLLGVDQ